MSATVLGCCQKILDLPRGLYCAWLLVSGKQGRVQRLQHHAWPSFLQGAGPADYDLGKLLTLVQENWELSSRIRRLEQLSSSGRNIRPGFTVMPIVGKEAGGSVSPQS